MFVDCKTLAKQSKSFILFLSGLHQLRKLGGQPAAADGRAERDELSHLSSAQAKSGSS